MNLETMTLILLALGCLPYRLSRYQCGRTRRWQVEALFWRLHCERQGRNGRTWRLTVPAIRRLADAVWAALRQLLG